jgi:hypothetical protein
MREKEIKRGYFCGTDELRIEEHTQNYRRSWSLMNRTKECEWLLVLCKDAATDLYSAIDVSSR